MNYIFAFCELFVQLVLVNRILYFNKRRRRRQKGGGGEDGRGKEGGRREARLEGVGGR